jgi:hypothetical protein
LHFVIYMVLLHDLLDPRAEREKGVRWSRPSVGTVGAVLELEPVATISFVDGGCARGSDGWGRGGGEVRRGRRGDAVVSG